MRKETEYKNPIKSKHLPSTVVNSLTREVEERHMVRKGRNQSRGVLGNNWALWYHQMPQKFLNKIDFQTNGETQFYGLDKNKCALETHQLRTERHFKTDYRKGPLRYRPEILQKKKKKKKQNSSQIKLLSLRCCSNSWQIPKPHASDPHFAGEENQICSSNARSMSAKV